MENKERLKEIVGHRLQEIKEAIKMKEVGINSFGEVLCSTTIFDNSHRELTTHELKMMATRLGNVLFPVYVGMGKEYPVSINYEMSMEEMIDAGGYDGGSIDHLKKSYAVNKDGETFITTYLLHFQGVKTTQEIKERVKMEKMRFVKREELLAFGAQYPDLQRVCSRIITLFHDEPPLFLIGGGHHDDYYSQKRILIEILDVGKFKGSYCFLVTPELSC